MQEEKYLQMGEIRRKFMELPLREDINPCSKLAAFVSLASDVRSLLLGEGVEGHDSRLDAALDDLASVGAKVYVELSDQDAVYHGCMVENCAEA